MQIESMRSAAEITPADKSARGSNCVFHTNGHAHFDDRQRELLGAKGEETRQIGVIALSALSCNHTRIYTQSNTFQQITLLFVHKHELESAAAAGRAARLCAREAPSSLSKLDRDRERTRTGLALAPRIRIRGDDD